MYIQAEKMLFLYVMKRFFALIVVLLLTGIDLSASTYLWKSIEPDFDRLNEKIEFYRNKNNECPQISN